GVEIPAIQSRVRQGALALLGLVLIVYTRLPTTGTPTQAGATPVPTLAATTVAAQPAASVAQSGGSVLAIGVVADGKPIAARTFAPGQGARFSLTGRGGQRVTIVQRSRQ